MKWSKPKIFYNHALANLIASSTDTTGDFDVAYLLDRLEVTFLQAANTTVPYYVTSDAGTGETTIADYLTISGHNLNSIGATLGLQHSAGATTGSDLVTNGGFITDTSGWTAAASSLVSVSGGQSGNCLEVTNSGAASGSAHQDVAGLTVGETYKLSGYFKKGTGVSGAIKIGTTTDDDYYGSSAGLTDTSWAEYTFYFTAIETTARITLVNESAVSAETALFDTVSMLIVDWTDAFTGYTPSSDLTLIKEFSSQTKRFWRLKITGTLSAASYMAICYWGEAVELGYVSSSFDPHAEKKHANIIKSFTGHLQEIDEQWVERPFTLAFNDSNDELYQKIKALWDAVGLLNFVLQWEVTDHADDIWLMHIDDPMFEARLVKRGVYRNIILKLSGRKE